MSASYNKAFILGILSDLPHMRYSQHGDPHALLTLKCTTKDSPNDDTVHTDWVKAVCYHDAAEYAERSLNPGDLIWIEGPVELLQWTDGRSKVHKDTVIAAEKLMIVVPFRSDKNATKDGTLNNKPHDLESLKPRQPSPVTAAKRVQGAKKLSKASSPGNRKQMEKKRGSQPVKPTKNQKPKKTNKG